jgi:hypothetical protein
MESKGNDIYFLKIAPSEKKISLVAKDSPDSNSYNFLLEYK